MRGGVPFVTGIVLTSAWTAGCQPSPEALVEQHSATINRYCLDCHNFVERAGELSLERVELADVAAHAEVLENVVRRLRAGMMPPADQPRPDADTYHSLITWLESELDERWQPIMPPPGLHRLNRAEYANAIRDLLGLRVDSTLFLPADDSSRGFDNQAGTLGLSPALLEAYLSAAGRISRLAVGHVTSPTQTVYRVAEDASQNYHIEGLPFGTRGGMLIEHEFPADGEYQLEIVPVNMGNMGRDRPFGEVRGEQLDVLLDGERLALLDWDEEFGLSGGFGSRQQTITLRVPIKAGRRALGVTFLATNYAPLVNLNKPFERSTIETGGLPGYIFYPHVGTVRIEGPYEAAGAEDTPSRRKLFVCQPASPDEEAGCAHEIVTALARRAYRGNATPADIDVLMDFYEMGRRGGSFDHGIEMALQRVLADPKFLYRAEAQPEELAPGETYRLGDLELASRLSFFLWSSIPDDELLDLAEEGRLTDPAVLEAQVARMLADPRSAALTENFAGQWLNLRGLETHVPVVHAFPDFDDNLRQAFRRETELLFDSILRDDRSVVDLLTADYTFVNERLAKHYGIPNVYGSRFRRVALDEDFDARRGLLGHGSVLTVSSQPGRTSPVIRGNWVLQNVIGVPAPDPPPDVPELEADDEDSAGVAHQQTIRERMGQHLTNPACVPCHQLMDPIGFALENFDAIGRWRTEEHGQPIDVADVMYDGTPVHGIADVRAFLLQYSDQFARVAAEKLLTYALGRGVEHFDMPIVRSIVREAAEDDYRLSSLIQAVVRSEPFLMSTKGPSPSLPEGAEGV
jgi:hypothetical protein